MNKIKVESTLEKALKWSQKNPVKAGVICVSSLLVAKSIGLKKLTKLVVSAGATKLAK